MSSLTGKTNEEVVNKLRSVIFQNPQKRDKDNIYTGYETADEYLSGNIREKLKIATQVAKDDISYDINVKALEAAMPKPLTAAEIDVRLGATWIGEKNVEQFMFELLDTAYYRRSRGEIKVSYHEKSAEWNIDGKTKDSGNIKASVTFGTTRMNAYKIIEETLNLRDVRVYDTERDSDGKEHRILNRKETTLAQQKQGRSLFIGAEVIPDPNSKKYDNVMISFGVNKIYYRQKIPVPFSMFRPFSDTGANAYLFEAEIAQLVDGTKAGLIICYEQLLMRLWLLMFIGNGWQPPDVVLCPANNWWCRGTSLPVIQERHRELWGKILYMALMVAENKNR